MASYDAGTLCLLERADNNRPGKTERFLLYIEQAPGRDIFLTGRILETNEVIRLRPGGRYGYEAIYEDGRRTHFAFCTPKPPEYAKSHGYILPQQHHKTYMELIKTLLKFH